MNFNFNLISNIYHIKLNLYTIYKRLIKTQNSWSDNYYVHEQKITPHEDQTRRSSRSL